MERIEITSNKWKSNQVISLSIQELHKWKKWSPLAKQYLLECKGTIELKNMVQGYIKIIRGLYLWIDIRIKEIYRKEIDLSITLDNEIAQLERKGLSGLIN